jgi:hypothetical protein
MRNAASHSTQTEDCLPFIGKAMKNPHTDDLWALHIVGPDDLIAAPSAEEAQAAAEKFNLAMGVLDAEGDLLPGTTVYAEMDEWPHGAESHAHSLRRDWPEYA